MNQSIKSLLREDKSKKVYDIQEINRVAENASNGSVKDREELIQSHMTMVKGLVYRYAPAHPQYEDLISEGYQALIKAVDTYKPGSNFMTWAHTLVKNKIFEYINYKAATIHVPVKRNGEEQPYIDYEDYIQYDTIDEVEEIEHDDTQLLYMKRIEKVFQGGVLTTEETNVLRLKYYDDKKNIEISEILSITPSRVSTLITKALGKMNKYLTGKDTKKIDT